MPSRLYVLSFFLAKKKGPKKNATFANRSAGKRSPAAWPVEAFFYLSAVAASFALFHSYCSIKFLSIHLTDVCAISITKYDIDAKKHDTVT